MRIAMFTNTFAPLIGGIEKSVATFAEDLRKLGHEVLIVTLEQGETDHTEDGILRLPALHKAAGGQYAFLLPGAAGLNAALNEFAPDLIHAHQPFMLGSSAYRHAVRRGVPLVFTNHTLYERYADRTFLGEIEALERAARALAVVFSNRCDAVIAPTASIARILKSQGVEPAIEIVPTGIDIPKFACGDGTAFRRCYGIPDDVLLVGHLGRLIPAKRVEFLAEATAEFLKSTPDGYALFCGEGDSIPALSEHFAATGVEDRLILLGNLPETEIGDAYAAMDLFTFASMTDTQGIVLLEAMAAGTPVLAIRATGPEDLVIDGESGWLLDPETTPAEFAGELQKLVTGPNLRSHTAAARARAGEFDRQFCARALLDVYRKALKRKAAEGEAGDRSESAVESFQRRVEAEWQLLAGRAEIIRSLLPTRGFPRLPE
jgi:glycosyltransferase involved in cell wall biosynthesis